MDNKPQKSKVKDILSVVQSILQDLIMSMIFLQCSFLDSFIRYLLFYIIQMGLIMDRSIDAHEFTSQECECLLSMS